MSIIETVKKRYSTKAFDASKKLDDQQIIDLKTILRLSPSSLNYQPWHFLMVSSEGGKNKLAKACPGGFAFNIKKIKEASLVVVFCSQSNIDSNHYERIVEQESIDKRFKNETIKNERLAMMNGYLERLKEKPQSDVTAWLNKQCYIALGNVLLAAADIEIDTTPIEGFEPSIVDKEFDLHEKGLQSVVLAAFGHRSEEDFNAKLPKSRLKDELLFTDY